MERISAAMGIGQYLKNVLVIIFLQSVSSVIIFGLGTQSCVEGGSRCLAYVGKARMDLHLPRRRGPAASFFDGGIKDFCNHEDETCNNSDLVCTDILKLQVVEVMRIRVRQKGGLAQVFGYYGVMYESNYFHLLISEDRSEGIKVAGRPTVQGVKRCEEGEKDDLSAGKRQKVRSWRFMMPPLSKRKRTLR